MEYKYTLDEVREIIQNKNDKVTLLERNKIKEPSGRQWIYRQPDIGCIHYDKLAQWKSTPDRQSEKRSSKSGLW